MEETVKNVEFLWRSMKLNVEVNLRWTIKELGEILLQLTDVKPDTLKLLVPQAKGKGSKLIAPFSDDYSSLDMQETGILKLKSLRMLGVSHDEISEVSENNMKSDLRIAGFDDEEKRLRQLSAYKPHASLKLPPGPYTFSDFRTLRLPGIELNPPPLKALKIMHLLACDPGIIAIMNKHCWRVGIMTEMAPVGYVGITPKCILGFNKNHGEEISLRLRTDDLKGFRKYESIKKTLLHELAHMVFSEHDSNFLALNKQLNEEAESLDWTKSRSCTLSGHKVSDHYEDDADYILDSGNVSYKLGGSNTFSTARASSVAAAYHRYLSSSTSFSFGYPAPSDSSNFDVVPKKAVLHSELREPDPDDFEHKNIDDRKDTEPDPDDTLMLENHLDNFLHAEMVLENKLTFSETTMIDTIPNEMDDLMKIERKPDDSIITSASCSKRKSEEPDPDNDGEVISQVDRTQVMPDSNSSSDFRLVKTEPKIDHHKNDSHNIELQTIEEPVAAIFTQIQESIKILRSELTPQTSSSVLQTLSKIIRNIIEQPNELKFRRIRKANPQFQRNVANYKAAMEVLRTIGFYEDTVMDEVGEAETFLVLRRNDPGLLWLAKSSLENLSDCESSTDTVENIPVLCKECNDKLQKGLTSYYYKGLFVRMNF
ncbi:hypothetical protein AXF42_Ash002717 [Apostasia shenzhenica]|uniref:WLM domain-containing protein n=1 Tax=Apostasia shenzhenica TaxID=1088818 RepID=A0A2I0A732_9ASPA|nr:hypothetical protein AXF42_Ash002717 [Apostasia shenzhenica]